MVLKQSRRFFFFLIFAPPMRTERGPFQFALPFNISHTELNLFAFTRALAIITDRTDIPHFPSGHLRR